MFRGIKTVTIRLLLTANVVAIIAMLAVGYSDRLQPTLHPTLSVSGLLFPGFIVLNLLFFPLWVFIKPKNVLVPLFGFIISYVPVRTYCPVNMPEDPPEGALKILSYNTWSFHEERDADGNVVASAADYIVECNADIACLQEAWMGNIRTKTIADHYPYVKSCIIDNANSIMVASRYPIVKVERIFYESQINGSAAFFLDIEGDTVVVVNTHFESNVFSLEDRQQISDFVNGRLKKGDVEADTRNLLEKLTRAARIRRQLLHKLVGIPVHTRRCAGIVCAERDLIKSQQQSLLPEGIRLAEQVGDLEIEPAGVRQNRQGHVDLARLTGQDGRDLRCGDDTARDPCIIAGHLVFQAYIIPQVHVVHFIFQGEDTGDRLVASVSPRRGIFLFLPRRP